MDTKSWMYMEDIGRQIDDMIKDYKKIQLNAMNKDNPDLVVQATGSMIALNNLKRILGLKVLEEVDIEENES